MQNAPAIDDAPSIFIWKIRVSGIVQGVGFRPLIYRLANVYRLCGWVLNDPAGVLISIQGGQTEIDDFLVAISESAPALSKISNIKILEQTEHQRPVYHRFDILKSLTEGAKDTAVPLDSHVCEKCLCELMTSSDRRYRYPFINCTDCGPRFSLIRQMPYDRQHTTMSFFDMCPACHSEYADPGNRRYHAQPNACPLCGPKVSLSDRNGVICESESAIVSSIDALLDGKIVAIKSVGGFHLAVNALDGAAVERLRQRKKRDSKPFAIMVSSVASARNYVECDDQEAQLLASVARPIVLLRKKGRTCPTRIAPNNPDLGVMLASAPLHYLLLNEPRMPVLVMTSGNISGNPIVYQNDMALAQLFTVADYVLHHDRDIATRVDDSVIRCSNHPGLDRPLITFIRRSRGYAPYPVEVGSSLQKIVALGAELKTTVALADKEKVYISQHIGDLKNDDTFYSHQQCAEHMCQLYGLRPETIACDMHPSFRATRFAWEQGRKRVVPVQHHHAHMASCMAENHLEGPTIGVIFDGAGYGLDRTIWGSEFLTGDYMSFKRAAHLRPVYLLGGDKAVREPIRVGLALAVESMGHENTVLENLPSLRRLDDQKRHVLTTMLMKKVNATPTSSMGRLFDGVAALLDICVKAEYEAQGPIEMEAFLERDMSLDTPYSFEVDWGSEPAQIDYRPLIRDILSDIEQQRSASEISRRFHSTIVAIVTSVCQRLREGTGVNQIVLSGGVFLNEFLLVNCMVGLRRDGFSVHCHNTVPTNDGGISLGQIMVANAQLSTSR